LIQSTHRVARLVVILIAQMTWMTAQGADQGTVVISISGNSLRVPISYLPARERTLYSGATKVEALRLQVTLPDLGPFVDPEDNSPVFKRYQNELSILVDAARVNSDADRSKFFEKYSSEWTKNREKVSSQYSLQRFILPATKSSPLGGDDVYVSTDKKLGSAFITCTPERFPAPDSEQADEMRRKGQLVRNPLCNHIFFASTLPNTLIRVSYFRQHLHDWSLIQTKVSHLLENMRY